MLGCPKNIKSSKSQAPQGFYGCLDIENDEMNKKKILILSLSMSKQPEKPWGTWLFKLFVFLGHPNIGTQKMLQTKPLKNLILVSQSQHKRTVNNIIIFQKWNSVF